MMNKKMGNSKILNKRIKSLRYDLKKMKSIKSINSGKSFITKAELDEAARETLSALFDLLATLATLVVVVCLYFILVVLSLRFI